MIEFILADNACAPYDLETREYRVSFMEQKGLGQHNRKKADYVSID